MRSPTLVLFVISAIAAGPGCATDSSDDSYLEDGPPDGKTDTTGAYMLQVTDQLWRGSQPHERWIASLTDPAIRTPPCHTCGRSASR